MVYLPPHFTESRPAVLLDHIERYEFGLLVSHGPTGPIASHIPFLAERDGDGLTLLGHLARPNPQVAALAETGEALAIFAGPHAYVSPRWYGAGPSVPTWNYADVHAYGAARLIDDKDWLCDLLRRLAERHESRTDDAQNPQPWRMADLAEAYLDGMLAGIVGVEIAVGRLEGKFKLSQNRPPADRARVADALERRGDAEAAAVARLMRERGGG